MRCIPCNTYGTTVADRKSHVWHRCRMGSLSHVHSRMHNIPITFRTKVLPRHARVRSITCLDACSRRASSIHLSTIYVSHPLTSNSGGTRSRSKLSVWGTFAGQYPRRLVSVLTRKQRLVFSYRLRFDRKPIDQLRLGPHPRCSIAMALHVSLRRSSHDPLVIRHSVLHASRSVSLASNEFLPITLLSYPQHSCKTLR